jgi:hypothetical protein
MLRSRDSPHEDGRPALRKERVDVVNELIDRVVPYQIRCIRKAAERTECQSFMRRLLRSKRGRFSRAAYSSHWSLASRGLAWLRHPITTTTEVVDVTRLKVVALCFTLVGWQETSSRRPSALVHVGPNVALSPRGAAQTEPFIAADPSKPGVLLIATTEWVNERGFVPQVYVTTNGGRTWTRSVGPGVRCG